MFNEYIKHSAELERIKALPRRLSTDFDAADAFTEALKRPEGTMRLRALQALALHDLGLYDGVFCPVGVGDGKTLISLLAAYVVGAKWPLLLLPAGLIAKTIRDLKELEAHWFIPTNIRLFSYEMLGVVNAAAELDVYRPDLIIADEAHKLKNLGAAVTRRVARYMDEHPNTKFVAMSGTFLDRSLREFAHILRWCLKDKAPIPKTDYELEQWADALDEKVDEIRRIEPGALLDLASEEERTKYSPIVAARMGFRRRLVETPGVVASTVDGEHVGASIYVSAVTYDMSQTTAEHFRKLREELKTPDDWDVTPVDVWRHSRELALGFHQVWDPRPPEEWREARRNWFSFVRRVLAYSDRFDSPEHVERAILAGELVDTDGAYAKWDALRDTFREGVHYRVEPRWHDDSALKVAAKWMAKSPGLVWTEHVPFAQRLAEMTGAQYYGRQGLASDGELIDKASPKKSAIASIDANREGRNLQTIWNRNLIVSPQESPAVLQQTIARTHRPGLTASEVYVDIFLGCKEHAAAFSKCLAGTRAVHETTGAKQKLLLATIDWPTDYEIQQLRGPRWEGKPKAFVIPDPV